MHDLGNRPLTGFVLSIHFNRSIDFKNSDLEDLVIGSHGMMLESRTEKGLFHSSWTEHVIDAPRVTGLGYA